MKEYSDKEIMECLRTRQSYVVRYLHDRYLPMIRLMIYNLGGTSDDALDIFQDGLMILIEKIDSGEFSLTCKFKTFLYCICENLWKSVLLKRKTAVKYFRQKLNDDDEGDFTEQIDRRLYEDIVRSAFEALGPSCKNILTLYWEELTPREIADKLGLTYEYVKKKKCEAQTELIRKVKMHPDYKKIAADVNSADTEIISSSEILKSG